jgi:regulator of sirC expression with transglutaminase-like and TPR domain
MSHGPRYCRRAAYDLFAAQMQTLEETDALVRAAVAVSMHELPAGSVDRVEQSIADLAAEIRGRVKTGSRSALIAQLHHVLFDEYGFHGDTEDYYSPENSCLSRVLERRRGLPVTLALIYKCVGQQVGLKVRGVNSPIHFLAAVETDKSWMFVDPFHGGRVLTEDEIFDQMERLSGASITRSKALLSTATHAQWIARIIRNLEQIFHNDGRSDDELAMQELLALVAAIE